MDTGCGLLLTLSMLCRAASCPSNCALHKNAQIDSSVSLGFTATSSLQHKRNTICHLAGSAAHLASRGSYSQAQQFCSTRKPPATAGIKGSFTSSGIRDLQTLEEYTCNSQAVMCHGTQYMCVCVCARCVSGHVQITLTSSSASKLLCPAGAHLNCLAPALYCSR